jgi:hypothetical protein
MTVAERHIRDRAVMTELRSNSGRIPSAQTLVILTITGARPGTGPFFGNFSDL